MNNKKLLKLFLSLGFVVIFTNSFLMAKVTHMNMSDIVDQNLETSIKLLVEQKQTANTKRFNTVDSELDQFNKQLDDLENNLNKLNK